MPILFHSENQGSFSGREATMNVESHHTPLELQNFYRTEMNAKLARRIHGVYLASRGMTCPQIMQITGAKRRTVQQWVARYNRGGLEELRDKPRPGQPQHLPRHLEPKLMQRIEAGPSPSDGVSVFSSPVIRRIIEREFGVLYSISAVNYLLHRLGYSYLCPRPKHEKSDPAAQETFKKNSRKCWLKLPSIIPANK